MLSWIRRLLSTPRDDIAATVTVHYQSKKNYSEPRSAKLLKKATAKKREKDLSAAIDLLKQAYKAIEKESGGHTIATYLRLPMYLQQAGRNDEAWGEFNRLIAEGYCGQNRSREILPMEHSDIYDKMRLFLQREKQATRAVSFGVMSYLCWGQGLFYQKRWEELEGHKDLDNIIEALHPLLKKANRLDVTNEIAVLLMNLINDLPNAKLASVPKEVSRILADSQT